MNNQKNLFIKAVRSYWWVVLFVLLSTVVYAAGVQKKQKLVTALDEKIGVLTHQKKQILEEQQDLRLQIDSQSDPAWIELILMKTLGFVPEGSSKVYFYNE